MPCRFRGWHPSRTPPGPPFRALSSEASTSWQARHPGRPGAVLSERFRKRLRIRGPFCRYLENHRGRGTLMNRRIVIATAGSIAAVVAAGTLAVAMTVGTAPGRGPTTAAATSPPTSGASGRRVVTVYVDDPPAATDTTAPATSGAARAPRTPAPQAQSTGAGSPPAAPSSDAHAPSPAEPHDGVTTVPTTAAPAPTTAAPVACTGSDDGLTEAQKQAREAACHAAQHGADD